MAMSRVLRGADVKIYLGGNLYAESQGITYTIDYGEQEIYGIDSQFPQEIAPTRVSVQGTISGIRIKMAGGLQSYNIRTKINEILFAPYISLKVMDRHSDLVLLFVPNIKVTNEQVQVQTKGIVRVTFNFKGIVPYNLLDLNG